MLTKEYRIPLPLTVEEYRIAQLYMIARKSRQESHGEGSGVEILINEPYTDGPGPAGEGQYTKKNYHIGSHLPGWFKSLLPKSALTVEEEAWNAYPYTKTRYTCPFVDKFSLEIETIYSSDGGHQDNIFNLKGSDLQNRVVDLIDVVKDQLYGADYSKEEDPLLYVSKQTSRGPLNESWIDEYWNECKDKPYPLSNGKAIMCAYKLCKVEFKYWGMQTKIERFIHDVALRKTMLRAHRQAWAWQDEWCGLTMDDVRAIERETQEALARTMQTASTTNAPEVNDDIKSADKGIQRDATLSHPSLEEKPPMLSHMECIRRDSDSDSQDEFFDCEEMRASAISLNKWSSLEYLPVEEGDNDEVDESPYKFKGALFVRAPPPPRPLSPHPGNTPAEKMLILVFHAGTVVDTVADLSSKTVDVSTFRHSLESVARQHYPALSGRLTLRLIPIPPLCADALASLSLLATDNHESPQIPLGALPLFAVQNPDYQEHVSHAIQTANQAYQDSLREGMGIGARVAIVGDALGGIIAYDALCRSQDLPSRYGSETSITEDLDDTDSPKPRLLGLPNPRRRSSVCSEANASTNTNVSNVSYSAPKLEFEVSDLFSFGCPLGLVASFRKTEEKQGPPKPSCVQVYNLYHPMDPLASRLEPLIWNKLASTSPYLVPRYQRFPLGDGQPSEFVECLQQNSFLFSEFNPEGRRLSEASILSMQGDHIPSHALTSLNHRWWGHKRLDYALYCPEGLGQFPTSALPPLLHASFWESMDVVAFICRMLGGERQGEQIPQQAGLAGVFAHSRPCEKWLRKRTSVKIKNIGANHRGSDVIVREGAPQTIVARFMYGPLDVVALTGTFGEGLAQSYCYILAYVSGEKVDVYLLQDSSGEGECSLLVSDVTDRNGRLCVSVPTELLLPIGFHSLKLVVRGDHTSCVLTVAVLPPRILQAVVFSIDGSFTASMSVTGRDPKVRAGAVDVVRHWQELGYMILYITGRPDMQQKRVVSWLAQHNFPHGLVSFADGLTTEPLRQKTDYLRGLNQDVGVEIMAAYGSAKDIGVYGSLGLKPHQIFIVGKVAKKQASMVSVLAEGYASHLAELTSKPCKPALPNASLPLPRGCMAFPGNHSLLLRRRSAKRATSFPMGVTGGNLSPPSSNREIGRSPSRQPRS